MKHIWAPWRIQYIQAPKPKACILCEKPAETSDEANYILYRGRTNYIMLNSYPYNPAHLMVIPYRHVASLEDMTEEERHENTDIVARSVVILRQVFNPTGFNIGVNIGKTAGAGIDGHVHTHIVPRWQGDTNFVTVVGDIRVVPQALADTYKKLVGKF